jgi:hypothetical protein
MSLLCSTQDTPPFTTFVYRITFKIEQPFHKTCEKDKDLPIVGDWSQGSKNLQTKATNALHNLVMSSKCPKHYSNEYNDIEQLEKNPAKVSLTRSNG